MRNYTFFVEVDYCDKMIQLNKWKKCFFVITEMSICFEVDVVMMTCWKRNIKKHVSVDIVDYDETEKNFIEVFNEIWIDRDIDDFSCKWVSFDLFDLILCFLLINLTLLSDKFWYESIVLLSAVLVVMFVLFAMIAICVFSCLDQDFFCFL